MNKINNQLLDYKKLSMTQSTSNIYFKSCTLVKTKGLTRACILSYVYNSWILVYRPENASDMLNIFLD